MITKEIKVWDNYWKRGELHSCISASDQKNQTEVNDFWLAFYSKFRNDTVLLDIGTGNGLLPSLAVSYANEKEYSWEVHGIDLANIDPVRDVPDAKEILDQINFQGRIAAEELPFEAEYFDVVTSQYAIEYSDMTRTLPEISRVLKNGGEFCAIFHSDQSLVVLQNNENAREAAYLLASDIFDESKKLLHLILSGMAPNTNIQIYVDRYVENITELSRSYPSSSSLNIIPRMQNSLMEILKLRMQYYPQQILEMVDHAKRRLEEQRAILLNLVRSALDKTAIENLVRQLDSLGFEILLQEEFSIGVKGAVLGYCIRARKK